MHTNMLLSRLLNARLLRLTITSLLLFILPAAYIDTHTTIWTTRLTAASFYPSPQESSLLIRGFSVSLSSPVTRVAVCIIQESSSAPQASVYRSIDRYLVQVLKENGFSVHVFLHLAEEQRKTSSIHNAAPANRHLLQVLQPVSVTYQSAQDFCRLTHCAKSRANCPYALLHAQQCYDNIVAHERKTELRFDWVYKIRLDIALGANITTPNKLSKDTLYTNQNYPNSTLAALGFLTSMFPEKAHLLPSAPSHYLFAAPRSLAETVFNAVEAFRECALFDIPMTTISNEVGFLYWLIFRGVRCETQPWFWIFVTVTNGPDCNRVRWIRSKGQQDPSFIRRCVAYKRSNRI